MDRIKNSLKKKQIVFWEEVARDGAQAKTIMNAEERIDIAESHAKIFNQNGPDHLVFAAGFYSIGKDEQKIILTQAEKTENCWLAVNCRSVENEILGSLEIIKPAKYGRVAVVMPASERLCKIMLHKTIDETIKSSVEIAKFAMDKAGGIPIDIQLAGAFDCNPEILAEYASALNETGVATIGLGDTRGYIYPNEVGEFLDIVLNNADNDIVFGLHFHNDLGFGVANNLEAIKRGVTFPSTSWLGLAERNGLARTELLTFLLAHQPERLLKNTLLENRKLFESAPDLKKIKPVADKVSEYTGQKLSITDPIVGLGVNTISTGTPFVDTVSFQPFDPMEVLGIPKQIQLTQLASKRVIIEIAKKINMELSDNQIRNILKHVKKTAYNRNISRFSDEEITEIFTSFSQKVN